MQLGDTREQVEKMADFIIPATAERPPDMIIGTPDDPYLQRWHIVRDRDHGCIYLHRIDRGDGDRELHDHPWDNTSIILRGVMREVMSGEFFPGRTNSYRPGKTRLLTPGAEVFRKAEDAHRLEVVEGPIWSLFITGKNRREWGFHCPNGWRHWREFTAPHNSGEIGRGCA